MPHHWYSYCEWIALVFVSGLSAFRGAAAERSGALIILGVNIASDIAIVVTSPNVPQMMLFWLDLVLAFGLLAITLKFSSLWLGAAMLLQSIILFVHALALADDEVSSFSFMLTNNLVSWAMYACLLCATLMSWRNRREAAFPALHCR